MGKKEKSSLVLPYDFEAVFEYLSVEQAGRLIRAIYAYERRDEEPDFSDDTLLDITWKTNVKLKVDHNKQRYQEVVEARREAGKMGGRPKNEEKPKKPNGYLENQRKPKKADNDCDYDCDYDCECDCDKNHPSNIQTTSSNSIGGLGQKPVDNSSPDKIHNAEPEFDKPRPASLDGWNFKKSPEGDEYALSPPDAFKAFREAYPRKQGALRDVQAAWVNATETGHVLPGDLVYAARKYARTCRDEKTDQRYIKMPQNFISSGLWKQYVPKYLPSCPYCHGQGIYEDSGGMVKCDCDRRYGP